MSDLSRVNINDLKTQFQNRTSTQITAGIKELIDIVLSTNYGPNMQIPPKVLVVSTPIPVDTTNPNVLDMFQNSKERLQTFADELKALVDTYDKNVHFVDAAPHVQLSPVDGIHFDRKAHENFASLMNETIQKLFYSSQ